MHTQTLHRQNTIITLIASLMLILLIPATGCHDHLLPPSPQETPPQPTSVPDISDPAPKLILQTYTVPKGYGEKLRPILSRLLKDDKQQVGKIVFIPENELVVVAPAGIHKGITELLAKIENFPPLKTPKTIEINYWLVLGTPSSSENLQPDALGDKRLAPALKTITKQQGNMAFALMEHLSVRSLSDERIFLKGRTTTINHTASLHNNTVIADVNINVDVRMNNPQLNTRLQTTPGQLVVLGQAGYNQHRNSEEGTEDNSVLYFIIQTTVVD